MTSPGAAERHQEDGEPVPGPEELCAKADAALDRLWTRLEELTAQRADPAVLVELLGAGLHFEELRQEMSRFADVAGTSESLIEMGRQLERQAMAAEQAARPRARHARPGKRPHLRPVPAAAAVIVGTAALGGAGFVAHDAAATRPAAVLPSPHAVLRAAGLIPAHAVLVPSPVASGPRRALELHGAAPAPSPSPSVPVAAPPPPPPAPAPPPPVPGLQVSVRDLDLTGPSGTFTLAASGDAVDWSVSTDIPGASLSVTQGVLSSAQEPVTVVLTNPLGASGFVYVKFGDRGIATIWVTSTFGSLPVTLPSL